MFLEIYESNPDDYEDDLWFDETKTFTVDFISIDENKNFKYVESSDFFDYTLDALKVIINDSIEACFQLKNSSIISHF